jgi:hypothetical protein
MFGKKKDGHPGGATPAGGATLDPELQALMDLEEAERRATTPAGTVLDPELQALMDLEEAERRGDSDPF